MSNKKLDTKDLRILNELDRLGPRTSTLQLSSILNIPSRTIRYRLSRLKERGIISSIFPVMYERRLGIGSDFVLIEPTVKGVHEVRRFLDTSSVVPWYSPTQGQFNGFVAEMMYPLNHQRSNETYLKSLKKENLIRDFTLLSILDFEFKKADFSFFNIQSGWEYDWDEWGENFEKSIRIRRTAPHKMIMNTVLLEFDKRDIAILKMMSEHHEITFRDLGRALSLSKTEVNDRVRRLEKEGVIKEYKFIFTPFEDSLFIACFIRSNDMIDSVISSFYELPFPAYVIMCSQNTFCVRLDLTLHDFKGFLRGFDYIRPFVPDSFIQTLHAPVQKPTSVIYDLFENEQEGFGL